MVNHPRRANVYVIKAVVRGGSKIIEWIYEGAGSGTQAWNAWRAMRETNTTMDTREPFQSASLLRNGELVESLGAGEDFSRAWIREQDSARQ